MQDFTKEQKEKYIEALDACPVCGSSEIEWGHFDADSYTRVWQKVTCLSCDAVWHEIYHIVEIERKE